mmetsp:Transcript_10164/g.29872  ORF Transcript_10164/g.29872 Transcript_10164/m.29872 type:complete len:607 (+) Transcript_10164:2-1822(+)
MVVPMNASDASAVKHLLTATQRSVRPPPAAEVHAQPRARNHHPYRYRFDDFEDDYDSDSDDERDFRDLSHYATIDPSTGRVTELWLGIIDVNYSPHENQTTRHWRLSETDWDWLSHLDQLEHFKVSGCGALPVRQLKGLAHLRHISCSECGNFAQTAQRRGGEGESARELDEPDDSNNCVEESVDMNLPQVRSISLRCGFQPNPSGVAALRSMMDWIRNHLSGLETITIWRLDQQQPWTTTAAANRGVSHQRYLRLLVEELLDGLASSDGDSSQQPSKSNVTVLELNRCGLTAADFRRLLLEIVPDRFPCLERLSVSSNEIDQLPRVDIHSQRVARHAGAIYKKENEPEIEEERPESIRQRLGRLRRTLRQLHLSNNPILDFLGQSECDDDDDVPEQGTDEHDAIPQRRFRRMEELERLKDLLILFPRLSHLGYASCIHKVLRSSVDDWIVTTTPQDNDNDNDNDRIIERIPFAEYSTHLQSQIEYYLRINRGGRWLVEGMGADLGDPDHTRAGDLLNWLAVWPNILEWSYRTSSGGCFLIPLPPLVMRPSSQTPSQMSSSWSSSGSVFSCHSYNHWNNSNKNATAMYRLLRDGPALYGGGRFEDQ